ncbi:MAG: M23 family metallopeptidase [Crocinitomicaceae bacterium]|nr:M23 family metallopeptidase [Crocinitomicaceae bacterium]
MKQQYKYNPETLTYEKVQVSTGRRVFRVILVSAPSILLGLLLALFFTQRIDSPREKELNRDFKLQEAELQRLQKGMLLVNDVLDDIEERDENLYRQVLYAKEFPQEMRRMGTGGSDKYSYLRGLRNDSLLMLTSSGLDQLERRLNAQSLSFRELLKLVKDKENMITCIPSIQPVRNTDLKKAISGFGWRVDPIYKTRQMHTGMDFTAARGTEVYATGDGVVQIVENKAWGYGKSIVINHGYGYQTRYAHLSAIGVSEGQKVKRGHLIGLVGSTGRSTGPHLHYEVVKNGVKVNPIAYYHNDLSPDQYEELLKTSTKSSKTLD